MQSVVFYGPGELRLEDYPIPVPGENEVRLGVILAGICSTDLHICQGHFAIQPPRVLGHELVGLVDALGPGVPVHWLGQMCGVSPALFCGECAPCRSGAPELCANFACLGNTQDGAFAEFTLARLDQLAPLGNLSPESAVWLEPLACVLHAIRAASLVGRGPVLVIGAGTLGRLMVQVLRATGEAPLAVVDPNPLKIEQALAEGAQAGWVVPRSGPVPDVDREIQRWSVGGPQTIFDTTGAPAAIERALVWAGPKARILLFGVSDPAARLNIPPSLIFSKELTLSATAGMTPDSFQEAEKLLRSRRLDTAALVSTVIDLSEIPGVLRDRGSLQAGKVLVSPSGYRP